MKRRLITTLMAVLAYGTPTFALDDPTCPTEAPGGCDGCFVIDETTRIEAGTEYPGDGEPCIDTRMGARIFDRACACAANETVAGSTVCTPGTFTGTEDYYTRPCGEAEWSGPFYQSFLACDAVLSGDGCGSAAE